MSSTFFQLLIRKPVNITEINRQISEELKKSLPKGWGIIFKLKNNFINKPPDSSDISNYEWIIADFSDSSKYDQAYIFSEDLKKPLDARRYSELPLTHYSLSISIDSDLFILSEYFILKKSRTSTSYPIPRVKKGYICQIDDIAISRLIREVLKNNEKTVIKVGKYKILDSSELPILTNNNPVNQLMIDPGSSIQINFHYTIKSNNNLINFDVYPDIAQCLGEQQIPFYGDYTNYYQAFIQDELQKKYLYPLVIQIRSISSNSDDQARIAISLVQHIPYDYNKYFNINSNQVDKTTRYPYLVLSDNFGICSEKSLLLAFLLKELGFGVVLFVFNIENHMAVGIAVNLKYVTYGTNHAFVECTTPSIVTDNRGDYIGVGKLKSHPTIIPISTGLVYNRVEEEYNDAVTRNNLVSKGTTLDITQYNQWKLLCSKYGIKS